MLACFDFKNNFLIFLFCLQLFKAGFQDSRISKQIKDFACIYTSKASNLGLVSSLRPFRPPRDKMPHDHIIEGLQ